MTTYGLKVYDSLGSDYTVITPKIGSIVSSGRLTMPNTLNGDDTYGLVIDLPGTDPIPKSDITVLISPIEHTYKITNILYSYQHIGYMDSSISYYTHAKPTGIMTSWTAGDLTPGDSDNFDNFAGIFPVCFWDIKGGTSFTSVQLFAATCYLVYDTSAEEYIKVFSIGDNGVNKIEYVIAIKNYDYE